MCVGGVCACVCVCVGMLLHIHLCTYNRLQFLCVYHCQYTETHTHTHTHTPHTHTPHTHRVYSMPMGSLCIMHHYTEADEHRTSCLVVGYHMIYGLSLIYPPPICKPYLSPICKPYPPPICKPYLSPICKHYLSPIASYMHVFFTCSVVVINNFIRLHRGLCKQPTNILLGNIHLLW